MNENQKPLNGKAYGHISHLPNSRMGPADHSCHDGQFRICCEQTRDKHDRVIVTEKLDGSCCAVAKVNGEILALQRAGYLAATSPYPHLRHFADWVEKNTKRFEALAEGDRVVGEWLAQPHGTIYVLEHEPFVLFDWIGPDGRRPHDEARSFFSKTELPAAHVVHSGGAFSVHDAMEKLGTYGRHGATEAVEGAVWRVERKGKFDFIAKWVRPDKVDGKYLNPDRAMVEGSTL